MGSVPNVGLMAQAAEEYGSHDKTFEIPTDGTVRVVDQAGNVLLSTTSPRATSGGPARPRTSRSATGSSSPSPGPGPPARRPSSGSTPTGPTTPTSSPRSRPTCRTTTPTGLDIRILPPVEAIKLSLERIRRGEDTISVTGNVLRDYLTDLFPIMELGTSAKMLSIVPLINGGGLFETGAGGSRPSTSSSWSRRTTCAGTASASSSPSPSASSTTPRHRQQRAQVLADTLDRATGTFLDENKSPARRVGQIDNRGSHFYLAMYWAQELATQTDDAELAAVFADLAAELTENEEKIAGELLAVQGSPVDLGGYYRPDPEKTSAVMRPSATFNEALAKL
jgi:isocitrate dehydrogenase